MSFSILRAFNKIISFIIPPPAWRLPVILLCGVLIGVGVFIAQISNATSYLSSDPQACINCHVMHPQYATWQRSSHSEVTTCIDCHVPHDNIFNKYRFKASDGMRHATIFTMRTEPQVIRIKEEGAAAVQANCVRCHTSVLQDISIHDITYEDVMEGRGKLCWDCHREVPHGTVRSLSATPHAIVPDSPEVLADWLQTLTEDNHD